MLSRFSSAGVPVLLLAEIPFMMAKFATFDAFSKLAYSIFPQATESVAASLAVSLVSGMVGKLQPQRWWREMGSYYPLLRWLFCLVYGRPRIPSEPRLLHDERRWWITWIKAG